MVPRDATHDRTASNALTLPRPSATWLQLP